MIKNIVINLSIFVSAYVYWFLVEILYARNFELYGPYVTLIELSFLVFVFISLDYNYKTFRFSDEAKRVVVAVAIPAVQTVAFLCILYFYGIDLHFLAGYLV